MSRCSIFEKFTKKANQRELLQFLKSENYKSKNAMWHDPCDWVAFLPSSPLCSPRHTFYTILTLIHK